MSDQKRRILRGFSWVLFLFIIVYILPISSFAAEKFPSRPIELCLPWAPGGVTDWGNRLWGKYLEKYLGVSVVCSNKPGGGGVIGITYIANSRPDGYTLANVSDHLVISIIMGQATYSLEDIHVVAQVSRHTTVLAVNADSPWKTWQEFMDYARKNPGVKFAHTGIQSTPFLRMENLNKGANLKMIGVPLKGQADMIQALLGKHLPIAVFAGMDAKAQADAGNLRILLSFDSPAEVGLDPTIPDFNTVFGKSIPGFEVGQYLIAPGKIPAEIAEVLERAVEKMTKEPDFISEMRKNCFRPTFTNGKEMKGKILPEKMALIKGILKDIGSVK